MNGFARQAVLLALLDAMKGRESWNGETHIQKCSYFLQEGLGVPLELEFMLYKHGPFSFGLREVLGEMRGTFLIDVVSRYPYGPSIEVSEPGQRLRDRFPKTTSRYARQIDFVADNLAKRDVVTLERLGTALYVCNRHPELSPEQQADRIAELKPHITLDSAQTAVNEVATLLCAAPQVTDPAQLQPA